MGEIELELEYYRRPFKRGPVWFGGERWREREGAIVKARKNGGVWRYGEIAPVEGFGTEGMGEVRDFFGERWVGRVEAIPREFLASLWGVSSALWDLGDKNKKEGEEIRSAYLVRVEGGRKEILKEIDKAWDSGYRTFKWKVGRGEYREEVEVFLELWEWIGERGGRVRLDANGMLDLKGALRWMELLGKREVEYLEQPLKVGEEGVMGQMMGDYGVVIGLDESIVGMERLRRMRGFKGVYVIKPSLMGDCGEYMKWREGNREVEVVYSSVFETEVGLKRIEELIIWDGAHKKRDMGLGTREWWV